MNIDEIMRNRNNKMRPEDVISFYRQALHNNRNWLEQAIREEDTEEIERISIFIERGERELSYAETRLTMLAPDSLKPGVLSLPESVLVENALPAISG